jgi:transcriptional regulator
MYVPKAFAIDDLAQLQDFMEEFNFATVVTERDGELTASHIPFLLDRGVEPYGVLRAHVAIRNPQLQDFRSGSQALVIFQGPHTYISPSWYAKPENVPTWNYAVVHAYGVPKYWIWRPWPRC